MDNVVLLTALILLGVVFVPGMVIAGIETIIDWWRR